MNRMAELPLYRERIETMLDNTKFMIDEIAHLLDCPIDFVEFVVKSRWDKIVGERRT
jgi:hypothetical protein